MSFRFVDQALSVEATLGLTHGPKRNTASSRAAVRMNLTGCCVNFGAKSVDIRTRHLTRNDGLMNRTQSQGLRLSANFSEGRLIRILAVRAITNKCFDTRANQTL